MDKWKPILDLENISEDKIDEVIDKATFPARHELIQSLKLLTKLINDFFPTPLVFKTSLIQDLKNLKFKIQLVKYPKGFDNEEDIEYVLGNIATMVHSIFSDKFWKENYTVGMNLDKSNITMLCVLNKEKISLGEFDFNSNATTSSSLISDTLDWEDLAKMLQKWGNHNPTASFLNPKPKFEFTEPNLNTVQTSWFGINLIEPTTTSSMFFPHLGDIT